MGKVEAGIPEDDARNPAAIADNVGDNVGDVAGMGADLYESYYGSILAAMALAAAAAFGLGLETTDAFRLVLIAPALAGAGILCSIFAIRTVRAPENATFRQLLNSLHRGVYVASGLNVIAAALILLWLGSGIEGLAWTGLWGAIVTGLAAGLIIAIGTERYTSYEHKPTRRIADQAETGPATVIISGIAEGMISTWIPLVVTVFAILLSFNFAGGGESFLLGVFGVGIAAVGMLSTLAITLATDAYGPIADNAGGNAEMTHQPAHVRETTDMLDSLGNTTAATGKGFAIGSAALTALALLAAYVTTVQTSLSTLADDPFAATRTANAGQSLIHRGDGVFAITAGADVPVEAAVMRNNPEALRVIENVEADTGAPFSLGAGNYAWNTDRSAARATLPYTIESYGDDGTTVTAVDERAVDLEITPFASLTTRGLMDYYDVNLMNPRVLAGLFLGVMLVFVFCAMTMNAVGRAAKAMMVECRRQFEQMRAGFRDQGLPEADIADPLRWPERVHHNGVDYPDYANCVDISTRGALREMILPSLLAVAVPIAVGLILGVAAVMGLLAGTLVCGFAVAIFMANAGGAWDNAKKYVESGKLGGKGSDAHKATVVGDTVGDPFKDTSGPSLNILIKLVSVVSVVFAAVVVRYSPAISGALGF